MIGDLATDVEAGHNAVVAQFTWSPQGEDDLPATVRVKI